METHLYILQTPNDNEAIYCERISLRNNFLSLV
jgi:hypothetical protein